MNDDVFSAATEQRMRAAIPILSRHTGRRGIVALPTDMWEELSAFFQTNTWSIGGHAPVHHPFLSDPVLLETTDIIGPRAEPQP